MRADPTLLFFPFFRSTAYYRHHYASLWLAGRVRGAWEPLACLTVCAWLAYGSWDAAVAHQTEAIVLGSLLGLKLLGSLIALALGLRFGGAWRRHPTGLSWQFVQKLEMLGTIFCAAMVSQYTRAIGRCSSTPAFAAIFFLGFFINLSTTVLDPLHIFAVRLLIYAHHSAVVVYDSQTSPFWDDPALGGPNRGIEYLFVGFEILCVYASSFLFTSPRSELLRQKDTQVLARVILQRDVTLNLVTNFLPPVVSRYLQAQVIFLTIFFWPILPFLPPELRWGGE